MQPDLSYAAPGAAEFCCFRASACVDALSEETTQFAVQNTRYGVWLRGDDGLVGMRRLICDGGAFAHVTNIAARSSVQKLGFGAKITANLLGWANTPLLSGCHISRIADPGAKRLYEKYGFSLRACMARHVS